MAQLSHLYFTTGKPIALTGWTCVGKVMLGSLSDAKWSLSRFVIALLPRSECLLISWLQSLSSVILEPKKIKSVTVCIFPPIYLPWSDVIGCHDFCFWMFSFKPTSSLSSCTFIKKLFSSFLLFVIRVVSSASLGYWYFSQQSWFQLLWVIQSGISHDTLSI